MNRLAHHESADRSGDSTAVGFDDELLKSNFVRLSDLENALLAMQNALVSRNLDKLHEATRQLVCCHDDMKKLSLVNGSRKLSKTDPSRLERVSELRDAQKRVLHVARVQTFLLHRAERSLIILANALAGCEATYTSLGSKTKKPIPDISSGEIRCRA
jgi:hypothetical protein